MSEKDVIVKPEVVIQNVVATAKLKHGIDLNAIAKAFPNVEYRPQTFPGLPFKLDKPKSCTLIFSSGSMVCTGTKSEKEAKRAVLKVITELKKAGIIMTSGRPDFAVQNIVASIDLGDVSIDVEEAIHAAHNLGQSVMYEPEQFPGAIYRMKDPKVVFLIFSTGKLVCVGAKREEDVYRAVENLVAILEEIGVLF
ncbi:MAG: TATA-box-binding protein [Candidatus Bathyarchaeota archaeon]|nr:TATA-box-binding protein [Candidatus Bathyarchaeota archaeon]